MTDERKPGWLVRTAAVLAGVTMYSLSFGPACWIASRVYAFEGAVHAVYGPLARAAWACPGNAMINTLEAWGTLGEPPQPVFQSYTTVGVAWIIVFESSPEAIEFRNGRNHGVTRMPEGVR